MRKQSRSIHVINNIVTYIISGQCFTSPLSIFSLFFLIYSLSAPLFWFHVIINAIIAFISGASKTTVEVGTYRP